MQICIRYGGRLHCHYVPELMIPVSWKPPGPGPINYPASNGAVQNVDDTGGKPFVVLAHVEKA